MDGKETKWNVSWAYKREGISFSEPKCQAEWALAWGSIRAEGKHCPRNQGPIVYTSSCLIRIPTTWPWKRNLTYWPNFYTCKNKNKKNTSPVMIRWQNMHLVYFKKGCTFGSAKKIACCPHTHMYTPHHSYIHSHKYTQLTYINAVYIYISVTATKCSSPLTDGKAMA